MKTINIAIILLAALFSAKVVANNPELEGNPSQQQPARLDVADNSMNSTNAGGEQQTTVVDENGNLKVIGSPKGQQNPSPVTGMPQNPPGMMPPPQPMPPSPDNAPSPNGMMKLNPPQSKSEIVIPGNQMPQGANPNGANNNAPAIHVPPTNNIPDQNNPSAIPAHPPTTMDMQQNQPAY